MTTSLVSCAQVSSKAPRTRVTAPTRIRHGCGGYYFPCHPEVDEVFVSIDGRDFTLAEFMKMVGSFGGWGMRIEFVPEDELHQRPKLEVCEPDDARMPQG